MSNPSYPVGKFAMQAQSDAASRAEWIKEIAQTPAHLAEAIRGLKPAQLDTPYREGGWSVRQVIHHVADSHMNSYVRFRLALTEDEPEIKPYAEQLWAQLPDARTAPPELSLALLHPLHERWVLLLRSFAEPDWSRSYRHPEMGLVTLDEALQLYAWHGRHHTAHITNLREALGWNS
ncbi:MAG: putative metal-dependent hydrolase yfiT [Bryobacterales bacterium]|nr:putative metal-dependent hydrolase yfiT [Bryobacterales bacterium]